MGDFYKSNAVKFVAKNAIKAAENKRNCTIPFGHRLVLKNFLIEYSVFTVITLWQYISLPNTPPCLGFQWDTCRDVLKMSI